MTELGKVEKPAVESFKEKRKLYCVPNIYIVKDAPEDYKELAHKYWGEAAAQAEKLEAAGKIKKIFCESVHVQGDDALKTLSEINEQTARLIKKKVDEGAELFPVENPEIFGPFLDWANCLNVVRTQEVFSKILEFYTEFSNKRLTHIMGVINTNLADGEAGMLIMRDEDRVKLQFPADIEIFLVTPPSYDDILKWFRKKMKDMQSNSAE